MGKLDITLVSNLHLGFIFVGHNIDVPILARPHKKIEKKEWGAYRLDQPEKAKARAGTGVRLPAPPPNRE